MQRGTVYIAGPMRGYPLYNFPAFDAARDQLDAEGWEVISPADIDRELGFDETTDEAPPEFVREALIRDLQAIATCTHVCLLPGWRSSNGATIELAYARQIGLPVFELETRRDPKDESILLEAERLTTGDRNQDYGHPADNFSHTAELWNAMFGTSFAAQDVGYAMILAKLSRQHHRPKRDNLTDIGGYAGCVHKVNVELERRAREAAQ